MIIEPFVINKSYELSRFDCGESTLNQFLGLHMSRQQGGGFLRGYMLVKTDKAAIIHGFYTLTASGFERNSLPSRRHQRTAPYRQVPAVTLGRLAVDCLYQGQGWGQALVAHALNVVNKVATKVGIHGLFVVPLDTRVRAFYLQLGFISLAGNDAHAMFLPLASLPKT